MNLFDKHRARFEGAQAACRERFCWSPFPDMPSKYPGADRAQAAALVAPDLTIASGETDPVQAVLDATEVHMPANAAH